MDSTRCVLATIKIVQLCMSIFCLALRESAHMNPDLPEVHNTLFCGTFMGFTIIAIALLLGYCIRKPTPKEVDLFLGFVGGVCFYVCGVLSMYYPTIDEKMSILPPEEKAKYPFFQLCTNIALACFVTALLYMFEACVLYDIWWYERRRRKRRGDELARLTRRPTTAADDDDIDIDDEEDLPEGELGRLRLNAYCLSTAWTHIRASCTSRQPATRASESTTQQPQPGPSSALDPQRQRSSAGLGTRIRITPPRDDDEEDMDAKD